MKHKIAVESNLTPVRDLLQSKGYQVEHLTLDKINTNVLNNVDAIVITGENTNTLGIFDTKTKAPVINADGLSADEVYAELQSRLI